MTKKRPVSLQSTITALAIFLAVLFMAYGIVYLCACPSPALAAAVCGELIGLIISIAIIRSKIFSLPAKLAAKIPESMKIKIERLHRCINCCKLFLLSILSIVVATDFAALSLSVAGLYGPSAAIYSFLPTTYWIGLHPAFSLEMLAGAFVQNKDYDKAEPLYREVMSIRIKLCGPESDLAGAVYADFGDLCVRKNDLIAAEHWYRRSVALGPRTGRGYTALATVLRERGNFAESEQYYLKALALRKRVYGTSSKQYADTERGYLRLQQLQSQRSK